MSSLNAKYNIETNDWHLEYWDMEPNNHTVRMGMTDGSPVGTNIYFAGLSFGYTLTEVNADRVVIERRYPMEGHTLLCSDQEYIEEDGIVIKSNTQYRAVFWASHKGDTYETTLEFITPSGRTNYKNFTYNSVTNVYESSVPYPNDGHVYIWDDEAVEWVRFDEDSTPDILNNFEGQAGEANYNIANPETNYTRVQDATAPREIQGGRTPNWETIFSDPEHYAERTEQGY